MFVWKEVIDKQGIAVTCSYNELYMCRSCFNEYNKLLLKMAALNAKLECAIDKLSMAVSQA